MSLSASESPSGGGGFPYLPGQAGFNKRLRALAPQLLEAITLLARLSPSCCDRLRLLDSTPLPCAASRETVRRSALAGLGYGYCRRVPDKAQRLTRAAPPRARR